MAVEEHETIAAQIGRVFQSPTTSDTVRFVDKAVHFVAARTPWRGLVGLDFAAVQRADAGARKTICGVECALV